MNLNPFDLRGPEFLAFFVALSIVAFIVCIVWQRSIDARGPAVDENATAKEIAQDPYQIAYLRAGLNEVIRVAVVALVDRGLLIASAKDVKTSAPDAVDKARRPLDKAILLRFLKPASASTLFSDEVVVGEADTVGEPLRAKRLLRDATVQSERKFVINTVTLFIWAVAITKLGIALSRGRTNVGYLILLTIIVTIFLRATQQKGRTARGERILAKIGAYFSGLKARAKSIPVAEGAPEMTFLAAAYGLSVLPTDMTQIMLPLDLTPPRQAAAANNSGSSCGFTTSSCGSSSGSSCGSSSSCSGGSSCGGGGGGCGGCGS